jgi:hypothetical protein
MDVLSRRRSALGFAVILALIAAGCGSNSQLDARALLQRSKTLRSEAAEGALLAEDAVSGKATRIYTHEHVFELSTAASHIEATLRAAKNCARARARARPAGGPREPDQRRPPVGVIVAAGHHYFEHLDAVRPIASVVLAVLLWPLVLLGVSFHLK